MGCIRVSQAPSSQSSRKIKGKELSAEDKVLGLEELRAMKVLKSDGEGRKPFRFGQDLLFQIKGLVLI